MVPSQLDAADEGSLVARARAGRRAPSAQRRMRAAPRACSPSAATRRSVFFRTRPTYWDTMRTEMIGARTDLLALLDLLDENVGRRRSRMRRRPHLAKRSRRASRRVIARRRIRPDARARRRRGSRRIENVELRTGTIEALPIDDDDARRRGAVSRRALHHRSGQGDARDSSRAQARRTVAHRRPDVARSRRVRRPARPRLAGLRRRAGEGVVDQRGIHGVAIPAAARRSGRKGTDAVRRVGARRAD